MITERDIAAQALANLIVRDYGANPDLRREFKQSKEPYTFLVISVLGDLGRQINEEFNELWGEIITRLELQFGTPR